MNYTLHRVDEPEAVDTFLFDREHDEKVYMLLEDSDQVVVFNGGRPRVSNRWNKSSLLSAVGSTFRPVEAGVGNTFEFEVE